MVGSGISRVAAALRVVFACEIADHGLAMYEIVDVEGLWERWMPDVHHFIPKRHPLLNSCVPCMGLRVIDAVAYGTFKSFFNKTLIFRHGKAKSKGLLISVRKCSATEIWSIGDSVEGMPPVGVGIVRA